jgi:aldose sugar dehydrogenase
MTPSETWASGFRASNSLAFSLACELWELEHGQRGGDVWHLIEKGEEMRLAGGLLRGEL